MIETVEQEEEGSFSVTGFLRPCIAGVSHRLSPPHLFIRGELVRRAFVRRDGVPVAVMIDGVRHDLVPVTATAPAAEPDQPACLDDHPIYGREQG